MPYFVVFFKNGFSPNDLRKAQKATGAFFSTDDGDSLTCDIFQVYFVKGSPDFINYRGEAISAANQITALAEAQSIGGWCTSTNQFPRADDSVLLVYLSIFIIQCFNVIFIVAPDGARTHDDVL